MSSSILGPEWNLSPDGINIVTENGAISDQKTILKKALDSDLKAIGKPALSNELSKSQVGKIVLQIQKIRNISAPKAKEDSQAAPRMLKLTLTDGESYVQAIEVTPINSISREKTAPGTKAIINGASVVSGYLLIDPKNFTVLGGQVEHLYENWILAKSVQQSHRHVSTDGAPPWVSFGCKIVSGSQDKSFKSLEKSKEGNTDSEFEQQRKEAIAEVSTGAVRKNFGGRVKQNVQPAQSNQQYNRGKPNDRGDQDRGRKNKFGSKDTDVVEKLQKPSEKVSLFSFLEDKLPITEPKKPAVPSPSCNKNNCQDYHQKDPRIQQKIEARQNSKQQYNKNTSNSYSSKEKLSYNTSASKPSKPEAKSSFANKNLPQKSSTTNSEDPKPITSDIRDSPSSKNPANNSEDANSSRSNQQRYGSKDQNINGTQYRSNNDRYSQQQVEATNLYRSNRYPQHSANSNSTATYPRDNFSQQQNQYRNSSDRYSQQRNAPNYYGDSFGGPKLSRDSFGGPQYSRESFGGPQHSKDSFGGPQYSKDSFGGPQHSKDSFGGPQRSKDSFGGPQHTKDSFGGPQHTKDSFGGPQQNQMAPRQQYSNASNYPQSNLHYNQRNQQNFSQPSDLQNAEMHQLANNLSKMSVSSEFASRSLRQHLNLRPPKHQEIQDSASGCLNVGDQCLAKYWEDGKFYPAVIAAITEKTYAVQFKGYGNIEEVLKHDCFSAATAYNQNRNPNYNYQQNNFSGSSMEFRSRRGPPRN